MITKIVSGGQAGVDRAALDIGLGLRIEIGGYCPRGRKSEDGGIPERYPLIETAAADYKSRTELNVTHSDGTLILNMGPLSTGTALTAKLAQKHGKPCLIVRLDDADKPLGSGIREWIEANQIQTLNVAGPRESKCPGIYSMALACLYLAIMEEPEFNEGRGASIV